MENFSQRFNLIYEKFCSMAKPLGLPASKIAFARFVNSTQGKMQAWEKGQMPAAADIKTIHDKLGFAYDWLISGDGPMFDNGDNAATPDVDALKARVATLENELAEADRVNRKLTAKLFDGSGPGVGAAGAANAV